MSSEALGHLAHPIEPRGRGLALAAVGPIAIGGIVAARAEVLTPLLSTPAIIFGVVAATAPALYIALATTGTAPPLAKVARAFGASFAAFGTVLAGVLMPAVFLSLSSTSATTTFAVATVALALAGMLSLVRLSRELASAESTFTSSLVFFVWAAATAGIAGRLWIDLVREFAS